MSVIHLPNAHINLLVWAAREYGTRLGRRFITRTTETPAEDNHVETDAYGTYRELTPGAENEYATLLTSAHTASSNPRYNQRARSAVLYTEPAFTHREPLAVLKAISSYEYQTCEMPNWDTSEARTFCTNLREHLISHLPGYDAHPWIIEAA